MILIRDKSNNEGTFGHLVWGDDYLHTIELPWRDNKPNLSCIPEGRYRVQRRLSPRYGEVYCVQDVPGRSHILLHHGNYAGDKLKGYRTHSAGCILLGSRRGRIGGQSAVLASRSARRKFENRMRWEPFEMRIIDA